MADDAGIRQGKALPAFNGHVFRSTLHENDADGTRRRWVAPSLIMRMTAGRDLVIRAWRRAMGWLGTLMIGAVIGWAGTWRGRAGATRHARWIVVLACALAAMVIKMAGNIVDVFDDGSIAEWLCSVGAAMLMLGVVQQLPAGRLRNKRGSA
ncbi:hypothetical protein JOE11_005088 [Robbsia andropogonis]|nr:hypothetical protein [Robbsia andropogonis]MCP1121141.1 hypothetical protein [Robbsia andropogonis]MCP1130934.1 hypothetical protein [Robbsia andropogonis]